MCRYEQASTVCSCMHKKGEGGHISGIQESQRPLPGPGYTPMSYFQYSKSDGIESDLVCTVFRLGVLPSPTG